MSRVSLASQLPIAMVNGRPYRLLETAATLAAARPNPHRDSSAASASASTYSLPPNVTLATICGEKTELVAHLETCPNYGAIVGKTRATQKALESQYEVELTIPPSGANEPLKITGGSEGAVTNAWRDIESRLATRTRPAPYTHFISLPLCHPPLDLTALHSRLIKLDNAAPSTLVDARKLHFTVCLLRLTSNDEIERAKETLRQFQPRFNEIGPTEFDLKGLFVMKGRVKECKVMYSVPGDAQALAQIQLLGKELTKTFHSENLCSESEA